ncbi:MAG: metallophosphoesterase family protein [Planctomycetes bacterium]|uniref:metallophosphoesterase family protein n=1 Tax=Candidatus Wunengus sp. YC65 TaxID=3367701 RepID=UPI001DD1F0D5|nr:metallophosphoesterase family protein [Planctomycetota bacterium]MBI5795430.1 metallophosphoesterase family protein [Planctomycetota bacterium]
MKYIILSDIHGNVDALLAVIKEIAEKENPIDNLLIAGDIVGYGASPNECCEVIRYLIYGRKKLALENIKRIIAQPYFDSSQKDTLLNATLLLEKKGIAVGGNHDKEASGEPSLTSEMNPIAKTAVDWTNGILTKENIKFLLRLPLRIKFSKEGFEIVHSKPSYPQGYDYVKNAGALKYTTLWSKVTFGGHTHRPAAYIYTKETRTVNATVLIPADNYDMRLMLIEKGTTNKVESFTIDSRKDWKYYVNVGSVGQPRDGNPHACYVVFDSATRHICFKRVPYNTEAASKKIAEASLPNELAQRILKGS